MILGKKPLSMAEAKEYTEGDSGAEIKGFIKKFVKLDHKKAKELRSKLKEMDMMKMKEEHIVKVIDILPETPEDLNKIFSDVGLDEDEAKKILETVKEYK
jgi:DNA-directed RNA polymerase subunit F